MGLTPYGPGLNHFCTEPPASSVTMDKCSHHRSPQLHPNVMRKMNSHFKILFHLWNLFFKQRLRKKQRKESGSDHWVVADDPEGDSTEHNFKPLDITISQGPVSSGVVRVEPTHLSIAHAPLSAAGCHHILATRSPSWQNTVAFPNRAEGQCWSHVL